MKKIITAIGSNVLNNELKKEKEFRIIKEDIQYQEGVIEVLKENSDIDILIISELLSGKDDVIEFINKIKKISFTINIFIILEKKNEDLEYFLYTKNVLNIFYNNEIEIREMIELIRNFNNSGKIFLRQKETDQNINNKEKNKNNKNFINDLLKKERLKKKDLGKKIICISGTSGVGKSIFSINLAKSYEKQSNKIIIIDFDILNSSLHTILGVKKYSKKIQKKIKNNEILNSLKIEDLIIKINSKIDLISGINLLFDSKYKINYQKIKSILEIVREKYDKIIIDTSSECYLDYTKELIKNSDLNVFITEANILDIKKSRNLLNIYVNQWQISKERFNILFNKYNKNSIDINILKQVFSDFHIIGKLDNSLEYNLLINKNNKKNLKKNLQKEYGKIDKRLKNIK